MLSFCFFAFYCWFPDILAEVYFFELRFRTVKIGRGRRKCMFLLQRMRKRCSESTTQKKLLFSILVNFLLVFSLSFFFFF